MVSNHPFGVLDGLVICHLVAKVRTDFRVLSNSVLYRAEEIRPFLLPIDFAETKEALKTNLKSRAEAKAHLMAGGCLVIFPAGGVSTTPTHVAQARHRRRLEDVHRADDQPGPRAGGAGLSSPARTAACSKWRATSA